MPVMSTPSSLRLTCRFMAAPPISKCRVMVGTSLPDIILPQSTHSFNLGTAIIMAQQSVGSHDASLQATMEKWCLLGRPMGPSRPICGIPIQMVSISQGASSKALGSMLASTMKRGMSLQWGITKKKLKLIVWAATIPCHRSMNSPTQPRLPTDSTSSKTPTLICI